jgi:hypothetical protein
MELHYTIQSMCFLHALAKGCLAPYDDSVTRVQSRRPGSSDLNNYQEGASAHHIRDGVLF